MEQNADCTPEERRAALYRIAARHAQAMLVLDRMVRCAERAERVRLRHEDLLYTEVRHSVN